MAGISLVSLHVLEFRLLRRSWFDESGITSGVFRTAYVQPNEEDGDRQTQEPDIVTLRRWEQVHLVPRCGNTRKYRPLLGWRNTRDRCLYR